jgi:Flp pilus assembly protein TadG
MTMLRGSGELIVRRGVTRGADRPGESGQAVVLLTVLLMSLLGFAGFAIDYGFWAVSRAQVQRAADASALAGASEIPGGPGSANSLALSEYRKNGLPADAVSVAQSTNTRTDDSITVTASRDVGTWFAGVFGVHSVTVSASAQATIESFTTVNGLNVMPWGVLRGSYDPGQAYAIYTKNTANANNGAISLPYVQSANCPVPNGANDYSSEIAGTTQVCPVSVGETLDTKPGDNSGPTSQGLNQRITSWQSLDQIVQFQDDGTARLLVQNSPQLVVVPVLTNPSGQSQWPDGTSSPMTVVGFAWFVITSCGDPSHPTYCANNDGKQVNGVFVTLDSSATMGTPGPYDPDSNTAYTIELTR